MDNRKQFVHTPALSSLSLNHCHQEQGIHHHCNHCHHLDLQTIPPLPISKPGRLWRPWHPKEFSLSCSGNLPNVKTSITSATKVKSSSSRSWSGLVQPGTVCGSAGVHDSSNPQNFSTSSSSSSPSGALHKWLHFCPQPPAPLIPPTLLPRRVLMS